MAETEARQDEARLAEDRWLYPWLSLDKDLDAASLAVVFDHLDNDWLEIEKKYPVMLCHVLLGVELKSWGAIERGERHTLDPFTGPQRDPVTEYILMRWLSARGLMRSDEIGHLWAPLCEDAS